MSQHPGMSAPLPPSTAADWQTVRALAHKLYTQCQGEQGPYRGLAKGIRTLRNKLEEVDDALDEVTVRPEDLRVIQAAGESREALDRIDRALQHFRCGGRKEEERGDGSVIELQAGLVVVTQKLSDALGVLESTTAEVETVSDTATREVQSDSPVQLSASTSLSSAHRYGSTSSGWSVARGRDSQGYGADSTRTSVCSEALPGLRPHEEKEVLIVHTAVSPRPGLDSGSQSWSASDSWKSPFASPDPFLSMGFEAASSLLSGSLREGAGSPFSYSQASTPTSPPFVDARVVQSTPTSTSDAQVEATANGETKVEDLDTIHGLQTLKCKVVPLVETSSPTTKVDNILAEPRTGNEVTSNTPCTPDGLADDPVEDDAVSQLLDSNTSAHEESHPPADLLEVSPEMNSAECSAHDSSTESTSDNELATITEPEPTDEELRKALEIVLSEGGFDGAVPDLELDKSLQPEEHAADINKPLPACPTREAPPPPTSPQRPRPPIPKMPRRRAASHESKPRYRVVNPDLPKPTYVRRGSQSSEDLYTTSRPTSLRLPPQRVRSKSVEIPRDSEVPTVVVIPPTREQTIASIRSKSRVPEPPVIVLIPSPNESDLLESVADKTTSMPAPLSPTNGDGKMAAAEEDIRPPLPPRPKSRLVRYRGSMRGSPPVRSSHSFSDAGLEFDRRGLQIDDKELVTRRVSVDEMMQGKEVLDPRWQQRSQARRSLNLIQAPHARNVQDFYATDEESEMEARLDEERANSIIHYWNDFHWDMAEELILAHLERQVVLENTLLTRRMRHLLGVIASIQGQWHKALLLFISVLNGPITPASKLDAGDCAAAYWMADAYAMLNRRVEAVLAYSIAERGPLFQSEFRLKLYKCIRAEQAECLMGTGRYALRVNYDLEVQNRDPLAEDSILDPKYITGEAARFFLETEPWHPDDLSHQTFTLDANNSRAQSLWYLGGVSWMERHNLQLSRSAFEHPGAWPLVFDPFFSVANVARCRILPYECDLLQVFASNLAAKIPRTGPVGLARMDCFTCADLQWLIVTLRECLTMLEMEWSEVATVQGTWFMARYSFMQRRVATTHFFSLALYRQSIRSGYGVELCPGGMCSARVTRTEVVYDRGVHQEEAKRVRKLVREYLDAAAKRLKTQKEPPGPSSGVDGSRPGLHHRASSLAMSMLPPVPPRPRSRPNSFGAAV